jgi:type II secretory pathway component PulL
MDQFHKVLYVIYHTHLPEKNFEKIKQLRNELVMNAEAITLTSLPKRLADKEKDFKIAANSLLMVTKDLQAIADNEDTQKLEEAVEIVHSNYQKLEAIF